MTVATADGVCLPSASSPPLSPHQDLARRGRAHGHHPRPPARRSQPRWLYPFAAQSASRLSGDGTGSSATASRLASARWRITGSTARLRSKSDLVALCGKAWQRRRSAACRWQITTRGAITEAAQGDGARLIAHAYTRYLGDLSGGQILQRLLTRSLELRPAELSFYDFPRYADLTALKADYRKALDRAGALAPRSEAVVEEGAIAFTLNIELSCAVQAAMPSRSPRPRRNRAQRISAESDQF